MELLAVILVIIFVLRSEGALKKVPLTSRKLCNNDPKDVLTQKCYDSQYTKEVECDSRKIDRDQCNELNVLLNELSEKLLNEIGSAIDADWSIRRVNLEISTTKRVNLTVFGNLIDSFLLPRPMWSPVVEPFSDSDAKKYVFERYSQLWDPYFHHIVHQQYPSPEVCARSMMIVGHEDFVHPGYSDVRKIYFDELQYSPVIFASFVSIPLDKNNKGRAFVSDEDCPLEHKNRWTCSFLQMTNCSLPLGDQHQGGMSLYNSTNNGGAVIPGHSRGLVDRALAIEPRLSKEKHNIHQIMHKLQPFVYTSPFTHSSNMFKFHGPNEHQVPDFLFMEFLFRKNAFYRRKVAETLAGFREKYHLGDAIRTKERKFVAVHVRRSDRNMAGVNMTEFCHNLLVQRFTNVPQNCTYAHGVVKPCQGNENVLGCDRLEDIPVGAVTLDDAIRDAESLIDDSIRNMIVFSDEMDWVEEQIMKAKRDHQEWKFYTLDSPLQETTVHRFAGTGAGVYFHATIDLVQECDALLGHFTSGVPMTFAGAMCHHHAGMEGICPPVYNLKNRLY